MLRPRAEVVELCDFIRRQRAVVDADVVHNSSSESAVGFAESNGVGGSVRGIGDNNVIPCVCRER